MRGVHTLLPILILALLVLAPIDAVAQPSIDVEFYFPHYYNTTFKAQTNEQVIISGGFRGQGSFWGAIYITNEGSEPIDLLTVKLEVPVEAGFKVLRPPRDGVASDDGSYFIANVTGLQPGDTKRLSFQLAVPETIEPKAVDFVLTIMDAEGNVVFQETYKRPFVPEPFMVYLGTLIVSVVAIGATFYAIEKGKLYGASFKTKDIIYSTIFGIFLTVWVQVIGRSLGFFAMTNRLPIPFVNYAIGDIGYATFFVLGVLIVRKPGVATFIQFVYQFTSQLMFYGFDIRWYVYALAQAVPVDMYLAISNKYFLSQAEGATIPRPKGIWAVIDAALIGGLRAFFAWISLYYVFYPYLNHFYTTSYVVYMHTITMTVFNMIYGAFVALPLFKVLERLIP